MPRYFSGVVCQPEADYCDWIFDIIQAESAFVFHQGSANHQKYYEIQAGDFFILNFKRRLVAYGEVQNIHERINDEGWTKAIAVQQWIFFDATNRENGIDRYGIGSAHLGSNRDLIKELQPAFAQNIIQQIDAKRRNSSITVEQQLTMSKNDFMNNGPLNTILYGPPGTGKTYHTVQKAISIANPKFDLSQSREKIKEEYDRLRDEGQIEFITFHQSLSYEDFIEGIKPQKPASEDTFLKYKVEDGILKRLALKAVYKPDVQTKVFSLPETAYEQAQFYKMSLGSSQDEEDEAIYRYCIDNGYIALGWGDDTDFSNMSEAQITAMAKSGGIERFTGQAINYLIHYIKVGDYVVISNGNSFCRAIGRVTGAYKYAADSSIRYHQFRKVEWLIKDVNIPVEELYDRPFSQQSIYQIDKKGLKKDFFVKPIAVEADKEAEQLRNFVLIIDEINRGNVSAIFGELITLIEEDKRAGKSEALKVTLPYSGDIFSMPSNLYLIGTMNTADRSVEALDTALRRRFSFIEMPPVEDHEKIPADILIDSQVFNFREVLKTINRRLEKLTGRDHKIGHSYFMLGDNWEDYLQAFTDKIIPLLQEYFYGDWAKMCLVLGEGFVQLKAEPQKDETLFALLPQGRQTAIGDSLQDLAEKEVWQLTDWKEAGSQMFAAALKSLAPSAVTTPAHDNS